MIKKVKEFRKQFIECANLGFHKKTKFISFKKHPEMLPAFPNKEMIKAIKDKQWKGIDLLICGRFGGTCSTANAECRKLRGY